MSTSSQTDVSDFFETKRVGAFGKKVKIAIRPMTEEQARQAYPYRPYTKYAESRFGGDEICDDDSLLLDGDGTGCRMCQAVTKNEYLIDGVCPDCDGRSEYNGTDPHDPKNIE